MSSERKDIFSVRSMVFMAIFAALICIAGPIAVPVPGNLVPISLGTFAIYLTGAMLGGKRGTISVAVYIMLGAVGLPVFTNFMGGFAKLLGPTGGYIVGYVPLVLLTGIFAEMSAKKRWLMPVGMVLGTVVMYALGVAWIVVQTGADPVATTVSYVLPYLIGDSIKIALTTAIAVPLSSRLNAIIQSGSHSGLDK